MKTSRLKLLLCFAKYRKYLVPAVLLILVAVVYLVWYR
jgi:hypothetical protein